MSNSLEKNMQRCDDHAAFVTCIAESSRCTEHIINPLQHRVKVIRRLKTEDSLKQFNESQHMEVGSIEVFDQCLPVSR
jgi:hypothetical protein